MATVGTGLDASAFAFYDALRQYDIEDAVAHLSPDASWESPEGRFVGHDAIREHLSGWLTDPATRPSLTTADVMASGPFVHLVLSVSGRFGRWPQKVRLSMLVVRGKIEQVVWAPVRAAAAH